MHHYLNITISIIQIAVVIGTMILPQNLFQHKILLYGSFKRNWIDRKLFILIYLIVYFILAIESNLIYK